MHKILKLTGVSVLAIMATANANAAGYTCEELIEYTSCNPGYYLTGSSATSTSCPDGYTDSRSYFDDEEGTAYDADAGWCLEDVDNDDELLWKEWVIASDPYVDCAGTFFGHGCVLTEKLGMRLDADGSDYLSLTANVNSCLTCPDGYTCDGGTTQPYVGACEPGYTKYPVCPLGAFYDESFEQCWSFDDDQPVGKPIIAGPTCEKCPVGYLCAGGNEWAVACPAGSYCADAGASVATGKCNVGTYSTGGATAATCTSCPVTGLTDKDGATVVATTSGTGSTSASACFVGDDVEFKDDKGIWHYNNTCEYGNYSFSDRSEGQCINMSDYPDMTECPSGLTAVDGYDGDDGVCAVVPTTESACHTIGDAKWCVEGSADYEGWGDYPTDCACPWGWRCVDGQLSCIEI